MKIPFSFRKIFSFQTILETFSVFLTFCALVFEPEVFFRNFHLWAVPGALLCIVAQGIGVNLCAARLKSGGFEKSRRSARASVRESFVWLFGLVFLMLFQERISEPRIILSLELFFFLKIAICAWDSLEAASCLIGTETDCGREK